MPAECGAGGLRQEPANQIMVLKRGRQVPANQVRASHRATDPCSPDAANPPCTPHRPMSPVLHNGTMFSSPRNMPLGRNRRTSNDMQRAGNSPTATTARLPPRLGNTSSPYFEIPGSTPMSQVQPPTSNPSVRPQVVEAPTMLDLVAELASWRRERKAAYESALRASSA